MSKRCSAKNRNGKHCIDRATRRGPGPLNLVTNAVEHTPSGGTIVISLTHAGNEGISVEVTAAQFTISTPELFPPGGPRRQHQDSDLELPIVQK